MSTERIIVQKTIAPVFRSKLQKVLSTEPFTNPSTLIASPPVSKNRKLVLDALSKGARVLEGSQGTTTSKKDEQGSTRMLPIVIDQVKSDMDIYHTESFGPTVSLIIVETEEEAIKIANDTDYGLSSAIFTEDLRRGLRIARQINSGAVHINSMTVHDEASLPHGGVNRSGWGRFNGLEGLAEFLKTKSITWKD
jgi:acyl-CoA reductase-like NAD-dependent aldehyde dehydrogenase